MESERMGARQRHGFVHVDEEGVVAVVVAISLFLLFGAAALAIDLGSGWATKRDLNTDLDAAALAGARTLADETRVDASSCPAGGSATSSLQTAVESSVDSLVTANGDRATVQDVVIDCDRRTVRVVGSQQAQTTFAGVLGVNEINPAGYAVARASLGEGGRVLPLTFCVSIDKLADWVAAGAPAGTNVRIYYGDGPRHECGFTPGSWGWFGSGNVPTLRSWIETGYPGDISLPPNPECTGPADAGDGWCNGGTGAQPNLLDHPNQTDLDGLRCVDADWRNCTLYTFFIHDDIRNAAGTNVDYRPTAFLDAVIRGARSQGNTDNSYIDLTLVRWRSEPGEVAFQPNSSSLCSADGAPAGDPNCG
jgi:Flp pilus assembly protein TadG